MFDWKKGLQNAPHIGGSEQDFRKIVAWEEGSAPSFVVWRDYEEAVSEQIGEPGYWDYEEDLVADVTGGIEKGREADFYWAEVDLSAVIELAAKDNNTDPTP